MFAAMAGGGGDRRLVVEVVAAKGLMPKDGQGSCNAYCVVRYWGSFTTTRVFVFEILSNLKCSSALHWIGNVWSSGGSVDQC